MDTQVERAFVELQAKLAYLPPEEQALVQRAFAFARAAHGDQRRKSGQPYIMHPLAVARTLACLHMDAPTLAAALLHDVIEDTPVTYEEMEETFGQEIADLVAGVTKLGVNVKSLKMLSVMDEQELTYEQKTAVSLVNLFLAMTADLRVIIIKLVDRKHNMLTLKWLSVQKQERKARETLDLFVPVAARLGIRRFEQRLADLSLRVLEPEVHAEIERILQARRRLLKRDLEDTLTEVRHKFAKEGVEAQVEAFPERLFDLYQHIKSQGWEYARAHDGLRLRITVENQALCYTALGVLHDLFPPVPGQIMDYIAAPQDGLYRALQTVVIGLRGHPVEVHISTPTLQYLAEYGILVYLRHDRQAALPNFGLSWLTDLEELPHDDPETFLNLFKSEITPERIRVFTPKGDVIELPRGATPLDFAYAVHTEVGHSCRRALVNGRYVPLNTPLKNGDQVEIIKSLRIAPKRAWLDEDLGYTHYPYTRRRIRRWFTRQPEAQLLEEGRRQIEQEIQRWGGVEGWTGSEEEIEQLARQRGLTGEDFALRVGRGEIEPPELGFFILRQLWGEDEGPRRLTLEVKAMDRPHLLRDVAQIVAEDDLNMHSAWAQADDETELAVVQLTMEVQAMEQVVRVAHRLEHILGVLQVRRCRESVPLHLTPEAKGA
ncbi:MAG: RelA/SpoT family protein [Anaerolineae bacterium]